MRYNSSSCGNIPPIGWITVKLALDDLRVADKKGRVALGSKHAGKRFAVREEADGTAILTPVLVIPANTGTQDLTSLEGLQDDWDGRGSPAPSSSVIETAREVIAMLRAGAIARGARWVDPHVGSNERG